jgi:hypothetical protein
MSKIDAGGEIGLPRAGGSGIVPADLCEFYVSGSQAGIP